MIYAALLRAVNVGGRTIQMSGLRDLATELNFNNPHTLLASGNVLFEGDNMPPDEIEALFERKIVQRFDIETDCYVRTPAQWKTVIARNPFKDEAIDDPGRLVVVFLKSPPPKGALEAVRAAIVGRERIHLDGRHLYGVYPDGQGESKLTPALINKHMQRNGTARNWNTVQKIATALSG